MSYQPIKSKDLACKCGEVVKNCNADTVSVTCWRCVINNLRGYKQTEADGIKMIFEDMEEKEEK